MNLVSEFVTRTFALLYLVVGLFPDADATVLANIGSFLSDFTSKVSIVNYLFPVTTFFLVMSCVVVVESSIFAYKLILWISSHISLGFIKQ